MNTATAYGIVVGLVLVGGAAALAADAEPKYLPGGPLAGVELPLLPTENGEPAGYPGCIPELMGMPADAEGVLTSMAKWAPQGQAPMRQLYPGSVELWRAYMFKYMPMRPMFDVQSQVKLWTAPDLPARGNLRVEEYAAPVYWVPRHGEGGEPTGRFWKPRTVVRAGVKDPVFRLDFGELPYGLYCVRIVGAVETAKLQPFRKPVFVVLEVNDGIGGETTRHRMRIAYVDEFYSIAEIYFHAPVTRAYSADLYVDEGSQVELLVRNIVLDNALAGCDFRALKQRTVFSKHVPPPAVAPLSEERLRRDEAIWRAFPPTNRPGSGSRDRNPANPHLAFQHQATQLGADGMSEEEVAQKFGTWRALGVAGPRVFSNDPAFGQVFMRNDQMGLEYTIDDLRAGRPLPDPFPYKDDGCGLYFELKPEQGQVYCPIADAVDRVRVEWVNALTRGSQQWQDNADADAAHDAAIGLVRFALDMPTIDTFSQIPAVASIPGTSYQDSVARKRTTEALWLPHYANYELFPVWYDRLFSYIDGNEELARSVHRFVPWVQTSRDVVNLLDTYLIQTSAKKQMRYHWNTGPLGVADCAAAIGEKDAVAGMMEWTFTRAWKYPLKPAGLQDIMIVANDRVGRSFIGSYYYATPAQDDVDAVMRFREIGILPGQYDLSNQALYPKGPSSLYWAIETVMGGFDFPRIADVGGPDKPPIAHFMPKVTGAALPGWRVTGDPRFAWILKHRIGNKDIPPDEWRAIEEAAAKVPRAPWLENRSRQVYNWVTALETGVEQDDLSKRRCVYLRTGVGTGHSHEDSLDLQVIAHGAPMTIDGGQRPGYSTPGDANTRLHNTVMVDARSYGGQTWARTISDAEGARFMHAGGAPPAGASLFERQVALLDVDPSDAVEPNSYVFDVFRVRGGQMHTYNFHAMLNDELVVEPELAPVPPVPEGGEPNADQAWLRPYGRSVESWRAGDAGPIVRATWRYRRDGGHEAQMTPAFRPDSPNKYTRLHLLGAEGMRVLNAEAVCQRWDYHYSVLHVQRRGAEGADLETAFTALIEPYVGEPFIAGAELLEVRNNEADAERAVALAVRTTNGHTDLCLADGRPTQQRVVAGPQGEVRFSGEFGYLSYDDKGLRQAALTGGTLLLAGDLAIETPQREYTGVIEQADYLNKTMVIRGTWPASAAGRVFEVMAPGRTTSYTSVGIKDLGDGRSAIALKDGADYFRGVIEALDPAAGTVKCNLEPTMGALRGLSQGFTVSNEERTKFWRGDYVGNYTWRLTGAPVSAADFQPANALRAWEYGVGDQVRQSVFVGVRRVADGLYEVSADTDVAVRLPGGALEVSSDRQAWRAVGTRDGKVRLAAARFAEGPVYLRVR